jgi:hypothetical protein
MAQWKPIMLLASIVLVATAVVGVSGCGDDDDNPGDPDTGTDAPVSFPDQFVPPSDGGPDSKIDAGCNFTQFVIDLVNANTNATALPSTDLGDNCVDNQTPFPATFFQ